MELIKDLDLLITDGQKIANFAKLFTRLPEILEALNSAQVHLQEVESAVLDKVADLDRLQGVIDDAEANISALTGKFVELDDQVNQAKEDAKRKLSDIEQRETANLEMIRKANNDAAEASLKMMEFDLANHQEVIAKSEQAMKDKLATFDASIQEWALLEQEAIEKTEKAKAQLAAIIEKISG